MQFRSEIIKLFKECATAASGEYDPARVVGYGLAILGAIVFYCLTIYVTLKNGTFDATGFAIGNTGVCGAVGAAAVGVWVKRDAERTQTVPDGSSTKIDTTTTVSSTTTDSH